MVTPRPSLLRTLAILIASICAALFVCSCSRDMSPPTITQAEISTKFRHVDGWHGHWDRDTRTIYLSANPTRATWAHELCHAADSMGLPYHQVLLMAGNLPPNLSHLQDIAKQVSLLAMRSPGPRSHWIALGRICGAHAIGHPEILAHVRTHL